MMGRQVKFGLVAAALAALVVVAAAGAGLKTKAATTTLVFGASADPVILDGPLVSDGESLRPISLIFQGLVSLKPGTTIVEPQLATSWSTSKNGLAWTFNLRSGVKFQDGTPFNAAAVCFNFSRWYNFPGPLQTDAVTYYWNTVFGGFAHPAAGSPGPDKSLYKGCKAVGQNKAIIFLTRKSGGFLGALALSVFSIASPTALVKYKADAGTVTSDGVFQPTGTFGTQHPIGTGPYMFKSWTIGSKLVLVKNPTYWGNASSPPWSRSAKIDQLIFVPIPDNAARLQALQTGEIQGYDNVAPQDIPTVRSNPGLKIVNRPPFNVAYVGMNQSAPPFNNLLVRQALAYGLDRNSVVNAFYGGRGQTTNQFLPPQLFGYAKTGVPSYPYNPAKAKALLQQAGLKLPVKIDFWYPTNVSRPYMPDPARNFQAFQASLDNSGFQVVPHSAPWRPDYLATVQSGGAQVFLLGWTGDWGDPSDFLNVHFGSQTQQFGFNNPTLFALLQKADAQTDLEKRTALYQQASVAVMKFLPVVPYVHSTPALAFKSNVKGFIASPVGLDPFWLASMS
jgi:peptide/nickel transport system substrate-binding protein